MSNYSFLPLASPPLKIFDDKVSLCTKNANQIKLFRHLGLPIQKMKSM